MSLITLNLTITADVETALTILRRIDRKLDSLVATGANMSKELDDLTREVAENRSVTESAVILIAGMAQRIRDLKDDPVALAALAAELDANTAPLSVAVVENTPTPPATPVEPPVEPPVPPVEPPAVPLADIAPPPPDPIPPVDPDPPVSSIHPGGDTPTTAPQDPNDPFAPSTDPRNPNDPLV